MESTVEVWLLAASLIIAGVVIMVIGKKQGDGTLRRNWVAGLRTNQTMRSDAAWHAAHTATAQHVKFAGLILTCAGFAVLLVRPSEDWLLSAIVLGPTAITVSLVVYAGVRGHRIAKAINDLPQADSGPDH